MSGADDRAVSEVLSFALVFAIITTSVALAFVLGFPALEDERDAERVSNAERAFDILADNMDDIYRRGAPSRATEIKLSDAQLALSNEEKINVTVENSTDTIGSAVTTYQPIVYQSGDSTISYENGAVIRTDRDAARMQRDPGMLFDEDRTVIPYVQTRGSVESVGSQSTALVRSERSSSEVLFELQNESASYTVTLNVTTATNEQAVAWEAYLEEEISWKSDACQLATDTKVECEFGTDEVFVSVTRIDVSLN